MSSSKTEARVRTIHGTFDKWIWLDNWWLLDVVCGTILGNYVQNGLPVWLSIVGPPGSAKTVVVESLRGLPGVYGIGGFTPHTFASGIIKSAGNRKKVGILEKLADRRDGDSIISDGTKFLAFNDFGTLFALAPDVKQTILGQMRQVYDGHFEWEWGTGKKLDWYGRVGAISAATEEWDSQMQIFKRMGERFLVWREYRPSGIRASLRALSQTDSLMREELKEAMGLLNDYEIPDDVDTTASHGWLAELADWVAIARTPIPRDRFNKEPLDRARPESGARLAKQLNQLMKGLMIFRGENDDHEQVRFPVLRTALGSLPQLRLEILGSLPVQGATVQDLAMCLDMHRSPLRRACEDLMMLKILAKQEDSDLLVAHPKAEKFVEMCRKMWAAIRPKEEE